MLLKVTSNFYFDILMHWTLENSFTVITLGKMQLSALLSNTEILIMQDYSQLNASLLDHSRICIYGYNCTVEQNFCTLPCPPSIEVDNDKYYNNSNF